MLIFLSYIHCKLLKLSSPRGVPKIVTVRMKAVSLKKNKKNLVESLKAKNHQIFVEFFGHSFFSICDALFCLEQSWLFLAFCKLLVNEIV